MRHSIRSDTPQSLHDRRSSLRAQRAGTGLDKLERPEQAMLAVVLVPNSKNDMNDPLGELAALAESAGIIVVDAIVQKRTSLTAASAMGKGKIVELTERANANEADVIIFDNDLSPRQIRVLEERTALKVIDRTELILDIFASRAKTHAAQLQVELAQLQYTAPRIRGMWTHLERIAGAGGATAIGSVGGVGTRGPGERQIEIDRRIVKKRIAHLRQKIKEIDVRKQREVHARREHYTVSLVGYTNSGKSTLMNRLLDAERYVANQLFATLDTKTLRWDLGDGMHVLLSDTVGFIRDLPHALVASFRATLEEAIHADLLLHIVDASSPTAVQQMQAVEEVLTELGCHGLPRLTLLNKVDIADDVSLVELLALRHTTALKISALTGEGLDVMAEAVRERVLGDTTDVTLAIVQGNGKLIAEIDRRAEVRDRRYGTEAVELDVRINRDYLAELRGKHRTMKVIERSDPGPDGTRAPDDS